MGQRLSHKPIINGIIEIKIDDICYEQGSTIEGNLNVHMYQSFSTPYIKLRLKVEEFSKFGSREAHKLHFIKELTIAKFKHDILGPGNYSYPFKILVPNNLPNSFQYMDNECKASIEYLLESTLVSNTPNNSITSSILINVNKRFLCQNFQVSKENSKKLYSLFCYPQGESLLKVFLPSQNFLIDDTLKVYCEFDNRKSKLNGVNIQAKVTQYILLKDDRQTSKLIQNHIAKVNFNYLYKKRQISKFTLEIFISS